LYLWPESFEVHTSQSLAVHAAVSDNQLQATRQEQHLVQKLTQALLSRHISISKLLKTDTSTTTKAKTAQHQDQTSIDQNMVGPKVIAIKLDSTR
jgi:hypothetical protein